MISKMRRMLIKTGCLLMLAATAGAVQTQIMVQGFLTNATGTPYTTAQTTEFRVYQGGNANTAGSGTLYYDETASVTPSASGVFTYALGSGSPTVPFLVIGAGATVANVLSTTTFDTAQAVYLEISVGGIPLLPRLQLLGTPYAAIAGVAESLKPTYQVITVILTASSATITNLSVGAGVFNTIQANTITANSFTGAHVGDGSGLYNVNAATAAASSVAPGLLQNGVLLPVGNLVNGPIAPALLPPSIAFSTQPNTFTQPQSFPAGLSGSVANFATLQVGSLNVGALGGGFTVPAQDISSGPLSAGVLVPPGNLQQGLIPSGVLLPVGNLINGPLSPAMLPPSVAYSTQPNTYSQTQYFPVGVNSSTGVFNALSVGTLNANTLTGSYTVPAANISSGPLPAGVQVPVASLINGPIPASMLPASLNVGNGLKSNVVVNINAFSPQSQVDAHADILSVQGVVLTNVSVTASLQGAGASGLDTGSVAANTHYAMYVISNDAGTSVAGLLSRSATTPAMPTGFTHYRRVWWVLTNGSAQLVQQTQMGDWTYFTDGTIFSLSNPNGTVSFAGSIPPTSHLGSFALHAWGYGGGNCNARIAGAALPLVPLITVDVTNGTQYNVEQLPMDANQQMDTVTGGNCTMQTLGYFDTF